MKRSNNQILTVAQATRRAFGRPENNDAWAGHPTFTNIFIYIRLALENNLLSIRIVNSFDCRIPRPTSSKISPQY